LGGWGGGALIKPKVKKFGGKNKGGIVLVFGKKYNFI